mgnify:CR=1 FL=1
MDFTHEKIDPLADLKSLQTALTRLWVPRTSASTGAVR